MREIISPLSGIRSPFGGRSLTSPLALFAFGEQGVWFDPSDVANLNWRRNLLTWTEQFDNAAWTGSNTGTLLRNQTDPNGIANSATTLIANNAGGNGQVFVAQNFSTTSGLTYTLSAYIRAGTLSFAQVNIFNGFANSNAAFNFSAVTASVISGSGSALITPVGGGWYRCSITATSNATVSNATFRIALADDATDVNYLVDRNGTNSIIVFGAQAEIGSTATDYQRITDVNTEVIERFPNATLYQDPAGTTPVTTTGQSVGLMLDKSKGLVLGPELVTNGGFATDTDWSKGSGWTIGGGAASCDGSVQFSQLTQTNVAPVGRYFRVSFTLVSRGASVTNLRVVLGGVFVGQLDVSSAGTYSGYFLNSGSSSAFSLQTQAGTGAGFAVSIDNISVKELPGNHAVQATTANRPIYGIHPFGGRRNLLVRTEEFDNASWVKNSATITANTTESPVGTITADTLTATVGLAFHYTPVATALTVTGTYTHSIYVKKGTSTWMFMTVNDGSLNYFNFDTGLFGTAPDSPTVTPLPNGWFRLSVTRTLSAQGLNCGIGVAGGNGQANFTAAGTETLIIWGAQGEFGSTATNYQRVTDQYNVTEAGVSSVSYLFFDGVNDSLATPTITPGVDKAQVFAGVRKLSDAATQVYVELSSSWAGNPGALALYQDSSGPQLYASASRGNASVNANQVASVSTVFSAPRTDVITSTHDIAGDSTILRANGSQIAAATGDKGTGNFLAYPLYIGARAGTSLFFSGHLYSLIARFGPNLATGQISSTETWVAGKTGVVI